MPGTTAPDKVIVVFRFAAYKAITFQCAMNDEAEDFDTRKDSEKKIG
jgi:hypothetical protein